MRNTACRNSVLALAIAVAVVVAAPRAGAAPEEAGTMRAAVGRAREAHGVARIGEDQRLTELARRQAVRMRDAGRIFHNDGLPGELRAMTNDWSVVGENVGDGPSIENVQVAFMASAAHKRNVLDTRYNAIGIAVEHSADGRVWVAQVFARFEDPAPEQRFAPVAYFPTSCAGAPVTAEDGTVVGLGFYAC